MCVQHSWSNALEGGKQHLGLDQKTCAGASASDQVYCMPAQQAVDLESGARCWGYAAYLANRHMFPRLQGRDIFADS